MHKFTEKTVSRPGWYWFKPSHQGKGFCERFVLLEEDSFDDGNKWLSGRNCQGFYFGPIPVGELEQLPTPPV